MARHGVEMNYGDEFKNRVALIAGGTGARVVVTYQQQKELDALMAHASGAAASRLAGVGADITDAASVAAMVENPAIRQTDNRMTMMFDATLMENMFELDQNKLQREVEEIADADYFQQLQRRAQQLREQRK